MLKKDFDTVLLTKYGLTSERCAELAKADKEGRLAMLPYKAGSNVAITSSQSVFIMKNIQLSVVYEDKFGDVLKMNYESFNNFIKQGRVRQATEYII